jgi:hypothetical protein
MAERPFQLFGFCSGPFASFFLAAFTSLYGLSAARTSRGLACFRGRPSGPDISHGGGTAPSGAAPALPSGTLTFAEPVVVSASAGAPAHNLGGTPRRFPRQRHRRCSRLPKLACTAGSTPAWPGQHETNNEAHLNWASRASMTVRTTQQTFCRGRKCGLGLNVQAALSRNTPLPSNAPMSGAGARSAEASAPLAG